MGLALAAGLGGAGPAAAEPPPLHTLIFNINSNVAAGSSLHITGNRPELGSLSTVGSIRMYNAGGNQWIGRVAVPGSVSTTAVSNKFLARTTSSGTHCTAGNGSLGGAFVTTNLPLWEPGYTGKTIYYHSRMTNVVILHSTATGFAESPLMTRIGNGRAAGEHLYMISGIGVAGQPLQFVPRGFSNGIANVYDNSAYSGYGLNDYYTPLDTFFLQDKNIYNYFPPTNVSAPQVNNVANWPSSYTGNGIPSRGGRIYLPRGYTQNTNRRYPVLYMHDGQNVFDPGGSFGSWSADATATKEISQGRMRETIIVAVNNTGSRMSEYGTPQDGYTGNYYLNYLVNNVRPNINSTYRTLTNAMDTGVMGSSLGGLISAYIGLSTNVFGLIGAVSPSYWYGPNFRSWINTQPTKGNRIYQDAGTGEGSSMWDYFWPVYTYYLQDGYVVNDDLWYAIGCGQGHNEAAWAARLPGAFQYLLNLWDEPNGLETNAAMSPGSLRFAATHYTASETGGSVRVFVNRYGGSNGAASVTYATSNGTAFAGLDYSAASGPLSWTNGDFADKFFDVNIPDNGEYAGDRFFSARLSGAAGAALGSPIVTTVTILEDEPPPPPPPELVVTNPPGGVEVDHETEAFNVQGLANPAHWIGLVWSNQLTGQTGLAPIDNEWNIAGIPLGVGTNLISISATNLGLAGVLMSDSATHAAYLNGWTNGSSGGSGWTSGWSLVASVNNAGHFLSDETNDLNNSVGPIAWGMWATNLVADAWRNFPTNLAVGRVFTLRFDNNWIQNGGSVGFGLQNAAGSNLFEFLFIGGATNYTINDNVADRNSGIPWSGAGWPVAFQLTNSTQYRFTCGTNVVTGTLKNVADQSIRRFHTWNFSGGPDVDHNYCFNELAVTGGVGGAGVSTSVTIEISRAQPLFHDGIPMTWWNRFGLGTNSSADAHDDADFASNGEEYVADTDPLDPASVFSNVIHSAAGEFIIKLQAGPPTTNSRVYDVWYGTNLLDGIWIPMLFDVPGADDGGPLFLEVTNDTEALFYRTGVKLP
jgi:hypothetical protein